jgi:hypothetical protein
MKVYGIFPVKDLADPTDDRVQACISLVAEIVFDRLRADGDTFHYALDWRGPAGEAWEMFTDGSAKPHVVHLSDAEDLMRLIRLSVDPFSGKGANIRSIANCRAFTFGLDGQAFLCVRHEDEPPVSSDPSVVVVEERPDLLVDYDYFDGWVPC